MVPKKNCRFCSTEIDSKRRTKIFCNMECYKNHMKKRDVIVIEEKKQVEIPKQEVITINKNDPGWVNRLVSFLSGK